MKEFSRSQFAAALANVLGTNLEAVEDVFDEFDLPTLENAETFAEARETNDQAHAAWDPMGLATGVYVQMGDGRRIRVRVEEE